MSSRQPRPVRPIRCPRCFGLMVSPATISLEQAQSGEPIPQGAHKCVARPLEAIGQLPLLPEQLYAAP